MGSRGAAGLRRGLFDEPMEEPERGEQSLEFAQGPIEEEGVGFALHLTLVCGVSFPGSWLVAGLASCPSVGHGRLPTWRRSTAKELDGQTNRQTDRLTRWLAGWLAGYKGN